MLNEPNDQQKARFVIRNSADMTSTIGNDAGVYHRRRHFENRAFPYKAARTMPGIFRSDGLASYSHNRGKTLSALCASVANQTGVGVLLNGAYSTLFCGLANIKVLCTTPLPD
jgi:hypothetical protein